MKKILLALACIILLTCSISSKTTYSSETTIYVEDTTDENSKYGRCHVGCTCYICGRAFGYTKTSTEQTTK